MTYANTPQPPYYAAIFSSAHTGAHKGYAEDTETVWNWRRTIRASSAWEATGDDDLSIAVSYWESDETIRAFKELAEHLVIQKRGRDTYYRSYRMRIARVERDYGFND